MATHRHTDHLSGFATRKGGTGPGDRIAALRPDVVIQPWTEEPESAARSLGPQDSVNRAFTSSLALMRDVAVAAMSESAHLDRALREEIQFLGYDGLSNRSAVRNLARMGKRGTAIYAHYGTRLPLTRLLPGVKVKVLGPPTLRQKADLARQVATQRDQFWHFHAFWSLAAGTAALSTPDALFPGAKTYATSRIPPESRWFIRRLKQARGEQLLRGVRAMDDALNNTSLILLFEVGGKRFLFPGDAQWENWEYALSRNAALLRNVDFYKVGHHGSLNATPKALWNLFARRGDRAKRRRLTTLVSTRSDSKHGHRDTHTEVPRETLLAELRQKSTLRSTQELEAGERMVLALTFDL